MSISKRTAQRAETAQAGPTVRPPQRKPRGRVFTGKAGIFKIMGMGDSGVPRGYSWRKHELEGR